VIRSCDQVPHPVSYTLHETRLTPTVTPVEAGDTPHLSGATWAIPLPAKRTDAQYATFRITGTSGVKSEKNGLVIAMTPFDSSAPRKKQN
jgi:hypothetical protein